LKPCYPALLERLPLTRWWCSGHLHQGFHTFPWKKLRPVCIRLDSHVRIQVGSSHAWAMSIIQFFSHIASLSRW
jgi:hypothetical protein